MNKPFNHGLSYIFTQRFFGNDPGHNFELTWHPLKRTDIGLENILRWEDDGGKITENTLSISRSVSELTSREY
jgi:hypothetical protein